MRAAAALRTDQGGSMSGGLKEAVIELREADALRITEEELQGGTDPLAIVDRVP